MKKLLLSALLGLIVSNPLYAASDVMCHFNSFTAPHGNKLLPVVSTHSVKLENKTDQVHEYTITYQTFINKGVIRSMTKWVTLQPHTSKVVDENFPMTTMKDFSNKQNFDASCRTHVACKYESPNFINGGGYISIT